MYIVLFLLTGFHFQFKIGQIRHAASYTAGIKMRRSTQYAGLQRCEFSSIEFGTASRGRIVNSTVHFYALVPV